MHKSLTTGRVVSLKYKVCIFLIYVCMHIYMCICIYIKDNCVSFSLLFSKVVIPFRIRTSNVWDFQFQYIPANTLFSGFFSFSSSRGRVVGSNCGVNLHFLSERLYTCLFAILFMFCPFLSVLFEFLFLLFHCIVYSFIYFIIYSRLLSFTR